MINERLDLLREALPYIQRFKNKIFVVKLSGKITEEQDTAEQKSAVDRYQSALLMPEWLMREAASRFDLRSWPVLYNLAEQSQVNITNLTVRLQRLGLIYLRDGDKTIYGSEDEYSGQKRLF